MGWKYWFDSFVCLSPEFLFLWTSWLQVLGWHLV
jgi:hypothetical protein